MLLICYKKVATVDFILTLLILSLAIFIFLLNFEDLCMSKLIFEVRKYNYPKNNGKIS